MPKITTNVELDYIELCKVISDYCLEKAGRPQGSCDVEFVYDPPIQRDLLPGEERAVLKVVVSFSGQAPKK